MSTTKTSVVDEAPVTAVPTKQSFGSRLKAHFKKWWWVHVIVFIVVFLVILLPVIYVAYPKIAQSAVNDSTLQIKSMIISDPTPESFHLDQQQILGTDSSYHPKIYEFDAEVSLGGADGPFATVTVPEVKSKDGAEIHVVQKVDLTDVDAFGDFNVAVMLQEELDLRIKGKPGLKQGGLPKTHVTYDKTVTMKGLNKLKGFAITEFHIMFPPVNGIGMNGTVSIPNPTVMTIAMGNVTFDLSLDGHYLGETRLHDLVLKPGENIVPIVGTVDHGYVISFLTSKKNPYKDGILPFDIAGNKSVYAGKELSYYTKALRANTLHVKLDVVGALRDVNVTLPGF
ncbi:uncharacterized protein N7515_007898 [Penicillium bovifimosum]|uniref:Uncharacterized protein n=1 Tax=Penicillium bovifimosum TaxID=126998 RepID=A0A9W9KXB5_9EURO|nr:uncharacterized protein N7515_007898 [Penicillium bovifimosum]KAJ5124073.1 hypothetical protein N7515_007898 [Penicillium bovifimosum]